MVNTILYCGHFDRNFRDLEPNKGTYRDKGGDPQPIDQVSDKVDGLTFRYMERVGKQFVAVGVEDLVLLVPVLLVPERHTDGKGFAPMPSQFGDESALQLLLDMIISNSHQRDDLGRLITKLRI